MVGRELNVCLIPTFLMHTTVVHIMYAQWWEGVQTLGCECKPPLSFVFAEGKSGICSNRAMDSPEDVIEPVAQSSTAQNLGRRRFMKDLNDLTPDELDGLMSSSGKNAVPFIDSFT